MATAEKDVKPSSAYPDLLQQEVSPSKTLSKSEKLNLLRDFPVFPSPYTGKKTEQGLQGEGKIFHASSPSTLMLFGEKFPLRQVSVGRRDEEERALPAGAISGVGMKEEINDNLWLSSGSTIKEGLHFLHQKFLPMPLRTKTTPLGPSVISLRSLKGAGGGGGGEMGISLFSQGTGGWTWGTGLKLCQGKFRLDIMENVFTGRVVKRWNRLPREVVESPSLEVFREQAEVIQVLFCPELFAEKKPRDDI
ncbi:hypothetical protein BTVI_85357 [Pitangus sulphuratus]|nr:hypothetical protein BTVI_85357 [Pitangus sulphuratus]